MNHMLERKYFVENKELKQDVSTDRLHQIHNILTRKDFIEDSDVMKQYVRSERPIKLHEQRADMNQPSDIEAVMKFIDFVAAREKSR